MQHKACHDPYRKSCGFCNPIQEVPDLHRSSVAMVRRNIGTYVLMCESLAVSWNSHTVHKSPMSITYANIV